MQDFCPLAESIEWGLGLRYLRERGSQVFLSDAAPIPYVINNDGVLSQNVAHVFFQSLAAAERAGTLEAEIFVLELGIGVGLFARFCAIRSRATSPAALPDTLAHMSM
jgi:hypothetical protein